MRLKDVEASSRVTRSAPNQECDAREDIAKIKRHVGSYASKGLEIGTMVDLTLAIAVTLAGMAWVALAAAPGGMRE